MIKFSFHASFRSS